MSKEKGSQKQRSRGIDNRMWPWFFAILNVCLWFWGWPNFVEGNTDHIQQQIVTIERELPERKRMADWCKEALAAIEKPPEVRPDVLLQRIRTAGEAFSFKLGESTVMPGTPAKMRYSGAGNWRAITAILNEIGREPASILEQLSITLRDDTLLEILIETKMREGAWRGDQGRVGIEPLSQSQQAFSITNLDPFATPIVSVPVRVHRPTVRYLGYFQDGPNETVIIEIHGQSQLCQIGEQPTKNIRVASATAERLGLIDERGSSWTVPMERRPGQR